MKSKIAKVTTIAALTTLAGLALVENNVKADVNDTSSSAVTTTNVDTTSQSTQTSSSATTTTFAMAQSTTPTNVELYSDNLVQVKATQNINFPSGYSLSTLSQIKEGDTQASQSFETTAIQGMSLNNYQSDPTAASESVDINNLTTDQVREINSYGLSIVNQARANFGEAPFTQDDFTISTAREMALQYQQKNESLMSGYWHDRTIIGANAENIAAFQVYDDNRAEFNSLARPFATAKGSELTDNSNIPLFKVTTMDDLRALVYYGIMGMLFNDASDSWGHAKNFLTINQPITTMALYPSIIRSKSGNGTINGQTVKFWVENIDMHYLWVTGSSSSSLDNTGTVAATWNVNDNGNYAYLDSVSINNNGQLTVAGWHATNASYSRLNHYIIVLDQNNKELARTLVSPVSRPDVAQAHNVYNAANSGFSTTIDLGSKLANVTGLKIISRYSSSTDGNTDYVDYWFNPVEVDQNNYAHLDSTNISGNTLELTGWNATNKATNRKYHYIILLDRNTGREITRQLVSDNTSRQDVANAYPHIYGAVNSGFDVKFDLSTINLGDDIQVLSRYTDDAAGNGNYVDYYFTPLQFDRQQYGYVDSVKFANNQLTLTGWNATNLSSNRKYHYAILIDKNTNKEVARTLITEGTSRPDVAKVYPNIANAANSGYNVTFDLSKLNLNDDYQVIFRYTDDIAGNGNYTDYYTETIKLQSLLPIDPSKTENRGSLDNFKVDENGNVVATGWHANSVSTYESNQFIILYDLTVNKQISVVKAKPVTRSDVAKAYPDIYNADQSGFNVTFNLPEGTLIKGHQYAIVSRLSTSSEGNGGQGLYTDYWFAGKTLI